MPYAPTNCYPKNCAITMGEDFCLYCKVAESDNITGVTFNIYNQSTDELVASYSNINGIKSGTDFEICDVPIKGWTDNNIAWCKPNMVLDSKYYWTAILKDNKNDVWICEGSEAEISAGNTTTNININANPNITKTKDLFYNGKQSFLVNNYEYFDELILKIMSIDTDDHEYTCSPISNSYGRAQTITEDMVQVGCEASYNGIILSLDSNNINKDNNNFIIQSSAWTGATVGSIVTLYRVKQQIQYTNSTDLETIPVSNNALILDVRRPSSSLGRTRTYGWITFDDISDFNYKVGECIIQLNGKKNRSSTSPSTFGAINIYPSNIYRKYGKIRIEFVLNGDREDDIELFYDNNNQYNYFNIQEYSDAYDTSSTYYITNDIQGNYYIQTYRDLSGNNIAFRLEDEKFTVNIGAYDTDKHRYNVSSDFLPYMGVYYCRLYEIFYIPTTASSNYVLYTNEISSSYNYFSVEQPPNIIITKTNPLQTNASETIEELYASVMSFKGTLSIDRIQKTFWRVYEGATSNLVYTSDDDYNSLEPELTYDGFKEDTDYSIELILKTENNSEYSQRYEFTTEVFQSKDGASVSAENHEEYIKVTPTNSADSFILKKIKNDETVDVTRLISCDYIKDYNTGINETVQYELIPVDAHSNYVATELAADLFKNNTDLVSVTVPEGITKIGNGCFEGCTSLTTVNLANSITELGDNCFKECTSLTSITLPQNLQKVGNYCFNDCDGLTSLTIPYSVTLLGKQFIDNNENFNLYICSVHITSKTGIVQRDEDDPDISYTKIKASSPISGSGDKISNFSFYSVEWNYSRNIIKMYPESATEKTYALIGAFAGENKYTNIQLIFLGTETIALNAEEVGVLESDIKSYSNNNILTYGVSLQGEYKKDNSQTEYHPSTIVTDTFKYLNIYTITIPNSVQTIEKNGLSSEHYKTISTSNLYTPTPGPSPTNIVKDYNGYIYYKYTDTNNSTKVALAGMNKIKWNTGIKINGYKENSSSFLCGRIDRDVLYNVSATSLEFGSNIEKSNIEDNNKPYIDQTLIYTFSNCPIQNIVNTQSLNQLQEVICKKYSYPKTFDNCMGLKKITCEFSSPGGVSHYNFADIPVILEKLIIDTTGNIVYIKANTMYTLVNWNYNEYEASDIEVDTGVESKLCINYKTNTGSRSEDRMIRFNGSSLEILNDTPKTSTLTNISSNLPNLTSIYTNNIAGLAKLFNYSKQSNVLVCKYAKKNGEEYSIFSYIIPNTITDLYISDLTDADYYTTQTGTTQINSVLGQKVKFDFYEKQEIHIDSYDPSITNISTSTPFVRSSNTYEQNINIPNYDFRYSKDGVIYERLTNASDVVIQNAFTLPPIYYKPVYSSQITTSDWQDVTIFGTTSKYNCSKDNIYEYNGERWDFALDVDCQTIAVNQKPQIIENANAIYPSFNFNKTNYLSQQIKTKIGNLRDYEYVGDNLAALKRFIKFAADDTIKIIRLKNGMCIPCIIQMTSIDTNYSVVNPPTDISFTWIQVGSADNLSLIEMGYN